MTQITQSALLGMLTICLGFFIKKWIQSLDKKMDKISVELAQKTDKTDCAGQIEILERRFSKRDENIKFLSENLACKCEENQFISHSHTEEGKIVLN